MLNPLCFVLMPFGKKPDSSGRIIDFDAIYDQVIAPAAEAAGLEVIRADEERTGGTIHKPMYERLIMCEYAIADLTTANPNVYYELGIRHACKPRSTVLLFAEGTVLPFDVALLRGTPYRLDAGGRPIDAEQTKAAITQRLMHLKGDHSDDSPLFQMVKGLPRYHLDHEITDLFRERAQHSKGIKGRLAAARKTGLAAVDAIANDPALADIANAETDLVIDLFLAYRDVKGFDKMIEVYAKMSEPLRRMRLTREQLGFAHNRLGQRDDAERVLQEVITEFGVNAETNGLLGRVYKDRWDAAQAAGDTSGARIALKKAVKTYLEGFEADWRDSYPGINALTLMEMSDPPDPRQAALAPVVYYAALRRTSAPSADYWDHATLLEVAVLGRDWDAATTALDNALAVAKATWELETTANNLRLIRDKRSARGEDVAPIEALRTELLNHKV